ncbi:MAG: hypothetical protein RL757_2461 [Bacteroidota bacterium]|jgi:predicted RND superfamily exporter protein
MMRFRVIDVTKHRKKVFYIFGILSVVAVFFVARLRFSFDFEQFFPKGDDDLTFFQDFIKDFETDDNFLLVAIPNVKNSIIKAQRGGLLGLIDKFGSDKNAAPELDKNGVILGGGVFDTAFLQKFDQFVNKAQFLPFVKQAQSLTTLSLPVKTPFGVVAFPVLHTDDPEQLANDQEKVLNDERFVRNLISKDGSTLVCFLKTRDKLNLQESELLMDSLHALVKPFQFENYHVLGRANFQKELVWMEKREVAVSTIVAAILVGFIMTILFRRWKTVAIALGSIGLSMLLFFGLLSALGRELSAVAALYPVLMVIIGTADVIHMLSKYLDELRRGHSKAYAIQQTIEDIGLATLMTAVTTAIGFATLVSSRIGPIQDFGLNAALGVMVAYSTVLFFSTALLSYFDINDLVKERPEGTIWDKLMAWIYQVTKVHSRKIGFIALVILGVCLYGTSKIKTNYRIESNMPVGEKVTEDFFVFEKLFSGFRPLEYAVFAQQNHRANDFDVLTQMDKFEKYIKDSVPSIRSVTSITMLYKSLNQMFNNNSPSALVMTQNRDSFALFNTFVSQLPAAAVSANVLMSKDSTKARIATRILDLGADTVMAIGDRIDRWAVQNLDSSVVKLKRTGTGYIIDKNATYVRDDLVEGLFWEVGLIALLMGLMLKNVRMVVIFLIPNLFPLLFAAALLGFLGVDLDAGISMVFTVVFGIAIDDTIHFLSSFGINKNKGMTVDEALRVTLLETGKPVCLTTIILFFGFLVMLFSIHPPSVTIGKLIAVTLITALMSDLFINPILIRWWIKK